MAAGRAPLRMRLRGGPSREQEREPGAAPEVVSRSEFYFASDVWSVVRGAELRGNPCAAEVRTQRCARRGALCVCDLCDTFLALLRNDRFWVTVSLLRKTAP